MDKELLKHFALKSDLEHLVTKDEFNGFKDETFNRLDKVIGFLVRLDQERIFTHRALVRIDGKVEQLDDKLGNLGDRVDRL